MKVLITDKEIETLKQILLVISATKTPRGGATDQTKVLSHFLEKCEKAKSKEPKKKSEFTVAEFLLMAKFILGERLKEQLKPSPIWYKQMQFRLDSRNINKAMANVALETVRDTWKGDIWVDTLINSLDRLCVVTPRNQNKGKLGWLNQLESEYADNDT
jgi:hypothetical protein